MQTKYLVQTWMGYNSRPTEFNRTHTHTWKKLYFRVTSHNDDDHIHRHQFVKGFRRKFRTYNSVSQPMGRKIILWIDVLLAYNTLTIALTSVSVINVASFSDTAVMSAWPVCHKKCHVSLTTGLPTKQNYFFLKLSYSWLFFFLNFKNTSQNKKGFKFTTSWKKTTDITAIKGVTGLNPSSCRSL